MLDKEQFTDTYGYVTVDGKRAPVPAPSHFLHGGSGLKVGRITFLPGQPQIVADDGVGVFNAYRPPNIKRTDGSVQPWLELMEHVLPDLAVRQHYLQYFAHLLQRPATKINHALLLMGTIQGVGKDSVFAPISRILGALARFITPDDLANPFNDYLYETLLIVVEELAEFGNTKLPNQLKPILARPPDTLRINRKGVPQFDIPNVVHGFMMSNVECPLNIEPSDRRFHVYQTPAVKKPPESYVSYYKWLEKHATDVYGYLMRYDVAEFNPYAPPPMTTTKEMLIVASEPSLKQHLREIVDNLPDLTTLEQIRDKMPARLKGTTLHAIATPLKELGARELKRRIRGEKRSRVWALRNYEQYDDLGETALRQQCQRLQSVTLWSVSHDEMSTAPKAVASAIVRTTSGPFEKTSGPND